MSILGADGFPVGEVGKSQVPDEYAALRQQMDPAELARVYEAIGQRIASMKGTAVLDKRELVPRRKIEEAIHFWKEIYFTVTVEGRHLNGIEAYELGDPNKTPGVKCDKGPYIAMCNLMALEALLIMGEQMPTAEDGVMLAYASDREKDIAKLWKDTFAPTEFQAEWAWKAALGVMSGNKIAISEILDDYKSQLP